MSLALLFALLTFTISSPASADSPSQDLLIKASSPMKQQQVVQWARAMNASAQSLGDQWIRLSAEDFHIDEHLMRKLRKHKDVLYVQPNYEVRLLNNFKLTDPALRLKVMDLLNEGVTFKSTARDNPPVPRAPASVLVGADPELPQQWGMKDIGAREVWSSQRGSPEVIVAVIDSGVDYTHSDLVQNLWRNPGEAGSKANNGLDDDGNGYVDDVIGWDFASNDNKPFDLTLEPWQILLGGGNPGHGTHCAGNVAARGGNSIGISGVAPNVRVMALRFMTEKGGGTTSDSVAAIRYAVDNGAKIISASWGNMGEEDSEEGGNLALREAIAYAEDKGVLIVAAAGNGRKGGGFDNDSDPERTYPASYPNANIIAVAAVDEDGELGSFSNFGARTVDIAAPGVKIFSTTVGDKYSDKVAELPGVPAIYWDGTSMATPHVAGALALLWSEHPNWTPSQVKAQLLRSAKRIPSLRGKVLSQGKLDLKALLQAP